MESPRSPFALYQHLFTDVMKQSKALTVLRAALSSPRALAMVQHSRIPIKEITVTLNWVATIEIKGYHNPNVNPPGADFRWRIYPRGKRPPRSHEQIWEETVRVGDLEMLTTEQPDGRNCSLLLSECDDLQVTVRALIAFFATIFKNHYHTVVIINESVYWTIERFESLNLELKGFELSINDYYRPEEGRRRWMRYGLRHPTVQTLTNNTPLPEDFRHGPPIQIDVVRMRAPWFTLRNLYEAKCRRLSLMNCCLRTSDLIEYLARWRRGEVGDALETLYTRFETQHDFWAIETSFYDRRPLTRLQYRPNDIDFGAYRQYPPDQVTGFDLRRKTDGRVAIVTWHCMGIHFWIFVK